MLRNQKGLSRFEGEASSKTGEAGFFHLWIIFAILTAIIASWVLYSNFKPVVKPSPKPIVNTTPVPTITPTPPPAKPSSTPAPQQVKKGDLSALEKYCKEEVLKLPEVPFKYETKEGPRVSGAMAWVSKFMPEDRRISKHKSCSMAYSFNGKDAYAQMGFIYPTEGSKFDAAVIRNLLGKIDSSWERVLEADKSPDKFALIFKRENLKMGTVDYVDVFNGGLVLYIKFNTYYK